jgi:hypothetical protein
METSSVRGHPRNPAMSRRVFVLAFAILTLTHAEPERIKEPPKVPRASVGPVPEALRTKLKLDPFYEKYADAGGIPVLASKKVSDEGVAEAVFLIDAMLADRDDIRAALAGRGVRFVVMAPTEMTTDVPEQRHMKNDPRTDWDKRARGLGGKITSCGEENLLNLKGDRYRNENILIHEFSHAIHRYGIGVVEKDFDRKLQDCYRNAIDKGLWTDTYAATNHSEYWAEGVQSYFDCNAPPNKGVHNDINTREKLAKYDPDLFALIDATFKQSPYRYVRYDKRKN